MPGLHNPLASRILGYKAARPRLNGAGALLAAYWLAKIVTVDGHSTGSGKALFVVAVLAACGIWLVIFGYPKGSDGLAPVWWRLGLLVTAVVFVGVAFRDVP